MDSRRALLGRGLLGSQLLVFLQALGGMQKGIMKSVSAVLDPYRRSGAASLFYPVANEVYSIIG